MSAGRCFLSWYTWFAELAASMTTKCTTNATTTIAHSGPDNVLSDNAVFTTYTHENNPPKQSSMRLCKRKNRKIVLFELITGMYMVAAVITTEVNGNTIMNLTFAGSILGQRNGAMCMNVYMLIVYISVNSTTDTVRHDEDEDWLIEYANQYAITQTTIDAITFSDR
jgi:hypothetical protein